MLRRTSSTRPEVLPIRKRRQFALSFESLETRRLLHGGHGGSDLDPARALLE